MKHIFLLACLCLSMAAPAQLTMADIGLPDDMLAFQHTVITSGRVVTPAIVNGKVVFNTTNTTTSTYGLNFLHGKIHEEDFVYAGQSAGTYLFSKPAVTFTVNGQVHTVDGQLLQVWKDAAGLYSFRLIPRTSTYTLRNGLRWVKYSADQLAALAGITKEDLWAKESDYFFGVDRNPANHITSLFAVIEQAGSNQFKGQLYLNLQKHSGGYGNYTTCYNKSGVSYVVKWKIHNGCAGPCWQSTNLPAGSEQNVQAFAWDTSKEYVVIELEIEDTPGQSKQFPVHSYWTIKGCDVDDPCGLAHRLPRKPHNS